MLALIALTLVAPDGPQSMPVRLEEPAEVILRFKAVKDDVLYLSLLEGEAPRTVHSETQQDFCVIVRRTDPGFLADWRPQETGVGKCPSEPGYLIRTDAALVPTAFENWPEWRAKALASGELTSGAAEMLREMPQETALQVLVEPAYLLAQGQGAGMPTSSGEPLRWTEPVTFSLGAKGQGFATRSFDGFDGKHAVVSWSRTSAAEDWVKREHCRYHIDPQSGLAVRMACRLETDRVSEGEVIRRETRLVELTQTLVQ